MSNKRKLALFLAAAMLSLTACSGGADSSSSSNQPSAAAGVAVQVSQVPVEQISTENRVSGKISSDNQHSIMVAATAKCTAVYVEAGDMVQAGQKICALDLDSTLSNYNAASISYQSLVKQYNDQKVILDQQLQLAENNVNNLKALFEIGAASQLEIDNAEIQLAQAKAGRDSALAQLEAGIQSGQASLEQLNLVLEDVDSQGNVIAPISGTLTSLNAVENGFVSSAMPVAVIEGAGQMKVIVSVSETLVPKLVLGDSAQVTVSAIGTTFTGTIRAVEKTANMQTKLYAVTLTIPADVGGLMSGMSADVTFRTNTVEDAVVVPTQAILTSAGQQYVFVVDGDNAKRIDITTGLVGSGVTQVSSGLTGGEQLVTVGQTYLSDGDLVRVVSGEG